MHSFEERSAAYPTPMNLYNRIWQPHPAPLTHLHPLLQLQRKIGNQAITRILGVNAMPRTAIRIQRDKKDPPPTMTAAKDPVNEAKSEVNSVENQWKQTRGVAASFPEIKGWIDAGDAIVALLREHEDGFDRAIAAKDTDLAVAYKTIINTDVAASDYISLHVTVYSKLLKLRSRVDSLVKSFDKDKRNFTGRQEAEESIRTLKKLIDSVPKDSAIQLAKLNTGILYKFHAGQATERLIKVTSAADKTKIAALDSEIAEIKKLDLAVYAVVESENDFLKTAFKEGLHQAEEAVKEYIEVRNAIIDTDQDSDSGETEGSGSGSGSGSGTEEQKKKDKSNNEKKERDKGDKGGRRHEVRFQLQAGKKELVPSVKVTQTQSITVDQGVTGVDELMGRANKTWKKACQDAAGKMKKVLRGYPPTGVECPPTCGHVSDKMCDRDVEEGTYRLRIDFNNDAGHNFKS